jgi:hypothetical protein
MVVDTVSSPERFFGQMSQDSFTQVSEGVEFGKSE